MLEIDIENWNLHISLANTNFADREWSDSEYLAACNLAKDENFSKTITVRCCRALETYK